ncbi:MAG: lytic transglycosylase domain-containing protein [Deltaproteobacteria bacterium]|nr:lytic transglycosylase domain-containing protein [Deltaproteobacteria bacterium]
MVVIRIIFYIISQMIKDKDTMRFFVLTSLAILLTFPSSALADIYKYIDAEGVVHLTNVPTDAGAKYILVMREKRILLDKKLGDNISSYDHLIIKASEKHNVEPALIKAIIKAESNFNHRAVSRKGAKGLMQLMPATASSLQVKDSFHPENNIEGGVKYLRYLLNYFNGNLPLALAAYNAGENAVIRHRGIPPYRETQVYVRRVMSYLDKFR